jgi:cyclopropane-fatty-acyl-phospholipid synthase
MVEDRRTTAFREFLRNVREKLAFDVGFVLWDGSTVPDDLSASALAITFADEGAIASLIRRPNIQTLLNLWVARRMDLRNGTLFDLVARRPKIRTRELLRSLDKRHLMKTALGYLLVPAGGPRPLDRIANDGGRRDGSTSTNKDNIRHHYDVSNKFYAMFLDPEMVYSCAYFTNWDNDLATAQRAKLDMICRKLRLKPGESFLDIGCGWGALICHAAKQYGVHAHGVTLAEEQFHLTREKIARLGLQDRVSVELADYTSLKRSFDKIASIGMFEHVAIANQPAYFAAIHRLLNSNGLYLHHAITRPAKASEAAFRRRKAEYAALTRYIFPGAEVAHLGMSVADLERYGFEVHDVEDWREHYQRTCRHWHDRLNANFQSAVAEVGSVKARLWLIYLAGCSLAFGQNSIRVYQTLASKRQRGPSGLPPTRADLYAPT